MIPEFIQRFDARREELRTAFSQAHPESYADIVKMVVTAVFDPDAYSLTPDPNRIHKIDDGDYQGTLVFVIAGKGYQPSHYWYVRVYYGSCSGCDTLEGISRYSTKPPTLEQVDQYMTLALHIVQGLKPMQGEAACGEGKPAAKQCIGYPDCDGDLEGEPHSKECPLYSEPAAEPERKPQP